MKLPNVQAAQIAPEKIRDYLLSDTHPVGRSKARFFRSLGYTIGDADDLQAALLQIGKQEEVTVQEDTPFGPKYIVE